MLSVFQLAIGRLDQARDLGFVMCHRSPFHRFHLSLFRITSVLQTVAPVCTLLQK